VSPATVRAVWEDELDRLELEVLRVERMLGGAGPMPADSWTPPAVGGPIPDDLVARARDLLERQERAGAALREALASAHRQIAFGTRVTNATTAGPSQPVYVDLHA
jgi:hypothetical protein